MCDSTLLAHTVETLEFLNARIRQEFNHNEHSLACWVSTTSPSPPFGKLSWWCCWSVGDRCLVESRMFADRLVARASWFGNLRCPNASSEGPYKALSPSWTDTYHQGQVLNFSGRLAHPAERWIVVSAGVWLLEGVNSQQVWCRVWSFTLSVITPIMKFQFCPTVKTTSITVIYYTNVQKRVCRDRPLDLYSCHDT